jgi:hypothetical protein
MNTEQMLIVTYKAAYTVERLESIAEMLLRRLEHAHRTGRINDEMMDNGLKNKDLFLEAARQLKEENNTISAETVQLSNEINQHFKDTLPRITRQK